MSVACAKKGDCVSPLLRDTLEIKERKAAENEHFEDPDDVRDARAVWRPDPRVPDETRVLDGSTTASTSKMDARSLPDRLLGGGRGVGVTLASHFDVLSQ